MYKELIAAEGILWYILGFIVIYIAGFLAAGLSFKRFAVKPIGYEETELYDSVKISLSICSWLGFLVFWIVDITCWIKAKINRKYNHIRR